MSEVTTQQVAILRKENVQMIAQSAPQTYDTNALSSQRCADFGKRLLDEIKTHGMTDELDKRCAEYIDKAKRTVKAMNERRAPITKLFDEIRSQFTGMENTVDPAKKDTVPYQIQQYRNTYAAKKREEAERARREEMARQQRAAAINRYKQDCEDDYKRQFNCSVTNSINTLTDLNSSLTLENYEAQSDKIKKFQIELTNEWFHSLQSYAHKPVELIDAECIQIRQEILNRLSTQFKEQFKYEVGEYRDSIVDALPSKKRELERMAQANAEEKARMEAELKAREAAEARRLEDERKRKEEEAKAAQQVKSTATEMDGLFGQAAVATPVGYEPKTAVKLRVKANGADGILAIVSMWWSKEGQFLSLEELEKIFKKQITFVDKLANDKNYPEQINSPFVTYEEEVKAK